MFPLFKQPEDEWLEQANKVRLATVELKGAVTLVIKTTRFGLLGKREVTRLAGGIPAKLDSGQTVLIVPSNILSDFASETPAAKSVSVDGFSNDSFDKSLYEGLVQLAETNRGVGYHIALLPVEPSAGLPWQELGGFGKSQPMIAVRRPVGAPNGSFLHRRINWATLVNDGVDVWRATSFDGDRDLWNGSPIQSAESGEIVGMMVSDQNSCQFVSMAVLFYLTDQPE